MRSIAVFLTFLFALLPTTSGAAADNVAAQAWHVAPREAWVQPPPQHPSGVASAASAAAVELHDRQIKVSAAGDARYEHTRLRLDAAQTGEQATQFYVDVDPRFQDVVIHSLRLTPAHGPATLFADPQLREVIHAQAAEAEPHKRELQPHVLVSLQIPGTAPGDLLEYEYTVHSHVASLLSELTGHYAAQWTFGAEQTVHCEHLHVSWPPGRPLQFRLSGGSPGVAPQVQSRDGELDVLAWDLKPAVSEPDTPRWFESLVTVQLSDFTNWSQVASLLAPVYAVNVPHAPGVAPSAATAPAIILNALRQVQASVRAINGLGSGAYAPAEPALVLRRGYGDSRDLARLLASNLKQSGIDAEVALGDSRHGAVLDNRLPSPYVLDTGLVHAQVGGMQYWLYPAAPGPAMQLETTDPADLRHALLVATDAGTGQLILLPEPAADSRLHSVSRHFDLRAANTAPATLRIVTRFQGSWAQSMRASLLKESSAQLELQQIQNVAQDYPAAIPDGTVQLHDVTNSEALEISAAFVLPRPLGNADSQFSIFADAIGELVQPRDEATRHSPLSLPWPLRVEEHIEAALPDDFQAPTGTITIDSPAFHYQREVHLAAGRLSIEHRYVALMDHVDPANYAAFLQASAQVYQAVGLQVRPKGLAWQRGVNWLGSVWLAACAIAVIAAVLGVGVWRRLRRPA